ncbi:MAG: hypothetical protein MJK14_16525 [Rivularia sp. ALOHA_DT_140]|nr:hypothetical protein [Rivularia sp. ALOHA_DT_140]
MYKYIGAEEIYHSTAHLPPGKKILSIYDIDSWIGETEQQQDNWGLIAAAFVIDCIGYLGFAEKSESNHK